MQQLAELAHDFVLDLIEPLTLSPWPLRQLPYPTQMFGRLVRASLGTLHLGRLFVVFFEPGAGFLVARQTQRPHPNRFCPVLVAALSERVDQLRSCRCPLLVWIVDTQQHCCRKMRDSI